MIYPEESNKGTCNIGAIRCGFEMAEDHNKLFQITPSGCMTLFGYGDQLRALRVSCGEGCLYIQTDDYPELEIKLSNEKVAIGDPTLLRRLSGIHIKFAERQ